MYSFPKHMLLVGLVCSPFLSSALQAQVVVSEVRSIWSSGSQPAIAPSPSYRRFYLTLENQGDEHVRVHTVNVTWSRNGLRQGTSEVPLEDMVLIAGERIFATFTVQPTADAGFDAYSSFDVEAADVEEINLPQQTIDEHQHRGRLSSRVRVYCKNISTLGISGFQVKLVNRSADALTGVRFLVLGRDRRGAIVEARMCYLAQLPPGTTTLTESLDRIEVTRFTTAEAVDYAGKYGAVTAKSYSVDLLEVGGEPAERPERGAIWDVQFLPGVATRGG